MGRAENLDYLQLTFTPRLTNLLSTEIFPSNSKKGFFSLSGKES